MSNVPQVVARPTRTLTQLAPAGVLTEFVDSFIRDLSDRQYGALLGLLTLVIGYVQVLVENRIGKGFLREPQPPEKPVDVIEDGSVVGDPGKPVPAIPEEAYEPDARPLNPFGERGAVTLDNALLFLCVALIFLGWLCVTVELTTLAIVGFLAGLAVGAFAFLRALRVDR